MFEGDTHDPSAKEAARVCNNPFPKQKLVIIHIIFMCDRNNVMLSKLYRSFEKLMLPASPFFVETRICEKQWYFFISNNLEKSTFKSIMFFSQPLPGKQQFFTYLFYITAIFWVCREFQDLDYSGCI